MVTVPPGAACARVQPTLSNWSLLASANECAQREECQDALRTTSGDAGAQQLYSSLFAVENAVEESPGVGRKVIVRITPYAAHEAW